MPPPFANAIFDLAFGKSLRHGIEDKNRLRDDRLRGYSTRHHQLMAPGNLPFISGAVFPANPYYPPPGSSLHQRGSRHAHRELGPYTYYHNPANRGRSHHMQHHQRPGRFRDEFEEEDMFGDFSEDDYFEDGEYENDYDEEDDYLGSEASFHGHPPRSYYRRRPPHRPHPLHHRGHGHGHHVNPHQRHPGRYDVIDDPYVYGMGHGSPGVAGPGQYGGNGYYDDDSMYSYRTDETW